MANRHGRTPSDAGARLVKEGLRRSEFASTDFRDSAAGRQAYVQGTSLAVWEAMPLVRSYNADVSIDILVYTPEEVREWSAFPQAFVTTAVHEGKGLSAMVSLSTIKDKYPPAEMWGLSLYANAKGSAGGQAMWKRYEMLSRS